MIRNIKTVLFDVYGTLATWYPDRYVLHANAAGKFGIEVTKSGIDAGYAVAEAYMTRQNSDTPIRLMSFDERNQFFARFEQMVLAGCGIEVDIDLANRIWQEVAKQEYEMVLFDDVLGNLDALRERGYIVGIVSNVPSAGDQLADELGLSSSIDFAVTSSEVGVEKPNRRIFDEALRRADDTPPGKAVMVGDQIDSDVKGAVGAGIQPILLDRNDNHSDFLEHPRIKCLEQLQELLAHN